MRHLRPLLALAAVGLAVPSLAAAEPAGCAGTLSGAFTATFRCTVVARDLPDGTAVVEISLAEKVEGLASFGVGSWIIPGKLGKGRYAFDALGLGKSSLVIDKEGVLYTASRTTRGRGDASFDLASVERRAAPAGTYAIHGRYRARLIPLASARTDEVVVEVTF
jgi:hypothetical protein